MTHENPPPPPAAPPASSSDTPDDATTRPLGIPVVLEEGQPATVFTGDWVVASPHLFSSLFPSHSLPAHLAPDAPRTAHLIAVLREPIPFPPPPRRDDDDADPDDEPDSKLFVFPPGAVESAGQRVEVGTCTALQVGKGTMSCPEGYHILYLTAPLLSPLPSEATASASSILQPYLDALLALAPSAADAPTAAPVYSAAYFSPPPSGAATPAPAKAASPLPPNFLLTPSLSPPVSSSTSAAGSSAARTSLLVETLDLVPAAVEDVFWRIVGEQGREEGVKFFAREEVEGEDEDGEE
ncbi:hypothetical protein Rhopal_004892-T1 [Rhodotorula paludigena]|uniref:Uncharacterized protein n=1 Tax=Rhodotorula paludigena TaxID=86838 RepID=A0AAV5GS47_9BASI|nr:hypothetical protein Rhopal_004892-T1 [Rhodotorula paludigena]